MFKAFAIAGAVAGSVTLAAPAQAAVVFTTTWEADQVPGGPAPGTFIIYNNPPTATVAGWTVDTQLELQNNVAGAPAPMGGQVFAELDADYNSSIYRVIAPGTYTLSYLYSPRPGVAFDSNNINVSLDGANISMISGQGGGQTAWSMINSPRFTVTGAGVLRISAGGTSDSLGGYIDNITLTAVPEPTTWALFILGFGAVGHTMRRRSSKVRVAKASLNFA